LLVWFGLVWFVCVWFVSLFVSLFVLRCNSMPTACHCALHCADRGPRHCTDRTLAQAGWRPLNRLASTWSNRCNFAVCLLFGWFVGRSVGRSVVPLYPCNVVSWLV
jgi:hypothetical protein